MLASVTITDAVSIAASTKQFTAYLITVGDSDGARWSIRRRYSAFQALHKSLTESYPVVPALPGWSILPGSDSELVKSRQGPLEAFLRNCLASKEIQHDRDFLEWLGVRTEEAVSARGAAREALAESAALAALRSEVSALEEEKAAAAGRQARLAAMVAAAALIPVRVIV